MKKLILFLGIFLITSLSAEAPKWFTSGKLANYPAEYNYIGMGEGSSLENAQANAQKAIAAQLKVSIQAEVNLYTQELSGDMKSSYQELFESSTKTSVSETVKGIQFVDQAQDGDKYFVAAVLNMQQFATTLKGELDIEWTKISNLVSEGRNLIKDDKIFAGLDNFLDAQKFLTPFYTKKSIYDAMGTGSYKISEDITIASLNSEIRKILSGIKLSVVSGNDQTAKEGESLPKPIVFSVEYSGSKIPSIPIKITYENNKTIATENTDERGEVKCRVTALSLRNKRGSVIAKPNIYKLPGFYRKYLKNSATKADYSIAENTAMTFSIIIKDEDGNRLKSVENKIAKEVGRLGHNVSDNADFGLSGTVTMISSEKTEGYTGEQYLVKSEMILSLVINDSGKKVGSILATGTGLNSRSEEKALQASYKKLKINKRDFAEMFAEASDELAKYLPTPVEKVVPKKEKPITIDPTPSSDEQLDKIVKHDVFTFELINCKMDDRTITCSLIVANNSEDDTNLRIHRAQTKIFDEAGNEYSANFVKLANSETRGWNLDKLIIPKVPTPAEMVFEKVSSSVTKISLLSISMVSNGYRYKAEFRNVNIEFK
ncbi:MAG: LPP20 family lipoprotein [Candidatus Cloacimonadota bacterium]|nr:LPP20 family lipoprotein [Candidatus Cloacimonadota bacterium]